MRTGHLSVPQGMRVLVVMKDGNHLIRKFKERKGRFVHFSDGDSITTDKIRTLSIYKERSASFRSAPFPRSGPLR